MTQLPLLTCRSCCVNAAFQGTKQSRLCKVKHWKNTVAGWQYGNQIVHHVNTLFSCTMCFLDTWIHESTEDQLNRSVNCPWKLAGLIVMALKNTSIWKTQGCRGDVVNKDHLYDSTTSTLWAAAHTQHGYRTISWSDGCWVVFCFHSQLSAWSLCRCPTAKKEPNGENYSGLEDHKEEKKTLELKTKKGPSSNGFLSPTYWVHSSGATIKVSLTLPQLVHSAFFFFFFFFTFLLKDGCSVWGVRDSSNLCVQYVHRQPPHLPPLCCWRGTRASRSSRLTSACSEVDSASRRDLRCT